jgi:hypothetical protein
VSTYDDWKLATPPEYDELGPPPGEEDGPDEPADPALVETLPAPEEPADPLAHLIGRQDPDLDKDPFAAMLDGMLAAEGMSREDEPAERKQADFAEHEWEFKKEVVFEDDDVEVICKKCFRQMRMKRTQTTNEAMAAHQVNADCSLQITSEVMDS